MLVGDYVYSRAFEMMVALDDMRIMDVMASATNRIAEGEVLQLMNAHDPETTEERYFDVIYRKTAKLFEAGTQIAAILADAAAAVEAGMARYGKHLGTAFQLIDDVLDYRADRDELGKNLGDDLAEGKPTLPLIYALKHGYERAAGASCGPASNKAAPPILPRITAAIESTGGLRTLRASRGGRPPSPSRRSPICPTRRTSKPCANSRISRSNAPTDQSPSVLRRPPSGCSSAW